MSIKLMAQVWEHSEISEPSELLVLLALADWANDDGECWPAMKTLGAKARISDRMARTYVRRLEHKGLLVCPSTKGGKGHSNRYILRLDTRKPTSEIEASAKAETRKPTSENEAGTKAERRKPASGNECASKGGKAEVESRKGGSGVSQRRKPTSEEPIRTIKNHQRGTRICASWLLPRDWGEWAMHEEGLSEAQVRRVADTFRDYWISVPGQKGVKLDWEATWRNWIRRAVSSGDVKPEGKPVPSQPMTPEQEERLQKLRRELGRGDGDADGR